MNEWIIVKDLERKREREGRNQKYTRIFSFMRGRGNKRFGSILLDKSNFSIYTVHVTEIRIPFAGTRNRENLWYQELELKAIDRRRYRILDLLAVIRKPRHLSRHKPRKRNRERRGGGRGEGKQDSGTAYTPCRRSAGEIKPEARLLATASRSFRVNPWASHWIELNNKLTPLRALKRYSIISHPC